MAANLTNLALLFGAQRRYADAELLYRRALAIEEQALGADHPGVALILENYSRMLRQANRQAEAEQVAARARAIRARATP